MLTSLNTDIMSIAMDSTEVKQTEDVAPKRKLDDFTDPTDSEQESKKRKREAKAKKTLTEAERVHSEKKILLSWEQKCEFQDRDFGPEENDQFEQVRKKLSEDAKFQKKYGTVACGTILYETTLARDEITDADRKKCESKKMSQHRYLRYH